MSADCSLGNGPISTRSATSFRTPPLCPSRSSAGPLWQYRPVCQSVAASMVGTLRSDLYGCLGPRGDALFELVDAAACGGAADSLPHLSLVPGHRRGHGSVYAALRAGAVDADGMRAALARHALAGGLPAYAVDVSVVARCDAE